MTCRRKEGERWRRRRCWCAWAACPTRRAGLEKAGVKVNQRGFVEVDANLRTNKSHIYAIGDIVRGPMLAHKAEEEGTMAAEMIKTGHGHVNYDVIPGVVYTEPRSRWWARRRPS